MSPSLPASQPSPRISHGRGGFGNISNDPHVAATADSLHTPTLKQPTYTTGRGGAGNMAKNDDPVKARERQDVDVPPIRLEDEGKGFHIGRGGEGNFKRRDSEESKEGKEKERQGSKEAGVKGMVEKGKDFLTGKK